jgi:hypothetical protein
MLNKNKLLLCEKRLIDYDAWPTKNWLNGMEISIFLDIEEIWENSDVKVYYERKIIENIYSSKRSRKNNQIDDEYL